MNLRPIWRPAGRIAVAVATIVIAVPASPATGVGPSLGIVGDLARSDLESWIPLLSGALVLISIAMLTGFWVSVRLNRRIEERTVQLQASEARYRNLFDLAPTVLFEEDFTRVAQWLAEVRASGVQDVKAWLDAHPAEVRQAFGKIRIVRANRAAMAAMRASDVAGCQEALVRRASADVFSAFHEELLAIWEGRAQLTKELRVRGAEGRDEHWLMQWAAPIHGGRPDYAQVQITSTDLSALRATEERLRDVEDRWQMAVQGINAGIWEHDFRSGAVFFSDRWKEIIGYAPGEFPASRASFLEHLHPEDRPAVERALAEATAAPGVSYRTEFRMRCKDGSWRWVLSRGRCLFDERGRVVRMVGAHSDIDERKRAVAALRASEERYRELFDWTPVSTFEEDFTGVGAWLGERGLKTVADLRRHLEHESGALEESLARVRLVAANRGAAACLDAEGRRPVSPDARRIHQLALEAVVEGRGEFVAEMRLPTPQGGERSYNVRWLAAGSGAGLDFSRVLVVMFDITDLKRAEETIRRNEERWALAISGTQDGIWEYNYETHESFFSDRWKAMLGYAPDELPNTYESWHSRVHPEDWARVREAGTAHQQGRTEFYAVEFRMRHRDGRDRWILSRGRAVRHGDGKPVRLLGSHTDITAAKQAEEALRESGERYRLLFEANPTPMWVYDCETLKFLTVNEAAVRTYGYTREEFAQMTIFAIRPPDEVEKLKSALGRWGAGVPGTEVWRHQRKDGSIMFMEVTAHDQAFDGRKGVLVLVRDVTERHFAQERLRASEARYRTLFESAVEGVYESTEAGFSTVNPALARLLGYRDPAEMLANGRPVAEDFYIQPGRHAEFLEQLRAEDTVLDFESEVRCRDGSAKWISENARAVRDAHGNLLYVQGFVSDITDRKHAEDAIRASEERYRVLFENSPVAILEYDFRNVRNRLQALRESGVVDLARHLKANPEMVDEIAAETVISGINQASLELVGARSKQEAIQNLHRILTPEVSVARVAAYQAIWDGRNQTEGELVLKALDGTPRRVYYRWWLPELAGRESFEWTQVVIVDLTDIKRTEAALAAERERLSVTLRAMAEGVITTDIEGRVLFINEAAEKLTAWTGGAAVGRAFKEVCAFRHEKSRAEVPDPVALAIAEGRIVDLPLHTMLLDRQGVPGLVEGRSAPVQHGQGGAIGAVFVFRDVAERTRLEAEMMRASKLESVGILAGGIAHDFNNILTVVMGNITLAMLDTQVVTTAGRWLQEAERGVLRARDLTQQLLTFAKGGNPVRTAVQLPEIVRDAAEFALHGSKVRSEFDAPPDLWPADVDKGQIGQVVQNLVINAVQAMPEGGVIRIGMKNERFAEAADAPLATGDYLCISITDTGSGIRGEHLARIFDPYFTTKQSGSGLGLATVYSIVKKHQGHIVVDSVLGKGTTFRFWLPAAAAVVAPAGEAVTRVEQLAGRVLFMDDEQTIRSMAAMLLERLGFQATVVNDGAQAVRAYEQALASGRRFDLVIMDLTVPGGMGGRDAMKKLLALDPTVRAIVSSGYSSDPVMADHRAHGFRGMVPKPYKITDLAKTLRLVLDDAE